MHHFFVSGPLRGAGSVTITGPDVHHMKHVLRMRPGEVFSVSDDTAREYICRLDGFGEGAASAFGEVIREEPGRELDGTIWLFQGLAKGEKMEWIIQKATELGVSGIVPVLTRNTVVRLDRKKEMSRHLRWQSIAENAARQSKRGRIPEIGPFTDFKAALARAQDFDICLIPYEGEALRGTWDVREIRRGQRIAVFIGPEGGFDEEEIALARTRGAKPVGLGRRILRTETAGLVVLSVLMLKLEGGAEGVL